jgi:hypothetical protein
VSDGFLGRERVFGGRSERGIAYSHDEKIPHLVKMTREVLKLLPDDIPDSAKGAETIKRVLGSLGTVAQGIAELRSLFGTGYGKEGKAKGLSPRHARLAVGFAAPSLSNGVAKPWNTALSSLAI